MSKLRTVAEVKAELERLGFEVDDLTNSRHSGWTKGIYAPDGYVLAGSDCHCDCSCETWGDVLKAWNAGELELIPEAEAPLS